MYTKNCELDCIYLNQFDQLNSKKHKCDCVINILKSCSSNTYKHYNNTVFNDIRLCFINTHKYRKKINLNSQNIVFVENFSNTEYGICAEQINENVIIYFSGSNYYKHSIFNCYLNNKFIISILVIITHVLFLIFDKYLINFTKGLLLNYNIEGIRNRNVFNKGVFIMLIHLELYYFIYCVCCWCKANRIKKIILQGTSSGGAFALFTIGEIARICNHIKYKVNIKFIGLFSAGLNDLLYKILINNIKKYLLNFNVKIEVEHLIILGDNVSYIGKLFPFIKELKNKIICTLYVVNTKSHKYWHNNQFIKKYFYESTNFQFHKEFNYFEFLKQNNKIYEINNPDKIKIFLHLTLGGCGVKYTGDNKTLLENFCKLNNIKNKIFNNSIEYENINCIVNFYKNNKHNTQNNTQTQYIKIHNTIKIQKKLNIKILDYFGKFILLNTYFSFLIIKKMIQLLVNIIFIIKMKLKYREMYKIIQLENCSSINDLIYKQINNNYKIIESL